MHKETKTYLSLIIWIISLIAIGSIIGSFTKPEISNWYITLNRASLTPPNYVFPIAWTILYGAIGACGWTLWNAPKLENLALIKSLYIAQLILNWSWTPLFFSYHFTAISLFVLILMDIIVSLIILLSHQKIKAVSMLMTPYLLWIIFASYLNFYIWQYN